MRKASQAHTPAAHHGPGAGRRPDSRGAGLNHGLPLCGQTSIRISTLLIDPDTSEHMDDFDTANRTLELIRMRQQTSPRRLVAPGPTPEQVQALFEAAAQAPDHGVVVYRVTINQSASDHIHLIHYHSSEIGEKWTDRRGTNLKHSILE